MAPDEGARAPIMGASTLVAMAMLTTACFALPGALDDEAVDAAGEECLDEPVANASFSLRLSGWPAAQDDEYEIEVDCVVMAVEAVGAESVTLLACDDGGQRRPAMLRIAATEDGPPSWRPGMTVMLAYFHREARELGAEAFRGLSLRRAFNHGLLVAAVDGNTLSSGKWMGGVPAELLAPLVATEDRAYCGWEPSTDTLEPMQVSLSLYDEPLELVSGQRGTLPIPGDPDRFSVDLARATVGHCCHVETWFQLLVRRVS